MTNIITNENENTVLNKLDLLKRYDAKYVDFATGFLFFEGWKHVENTIPNEIDRFRLLFGFTDPEMAALLSKTLEEEDIEYIISKLSRSLSDSTLEDIEKDDKFKELLNDKNVYVRWVDKLHAKLYLYYKKELPEDLEERMLFDGRAIVGSSNLTTRGLTQEGEINVWVDKPNEVISLLEWFESVWNEGKDLDPEILLKAIVNEKSRRKVVEAGKFIDIEELGWSLIDAYLFLFWHLLGGVYSIDDVKSMVGGEGPLIKKHNEEAVIWAYQIIDKYGGVILADPVGTGKSYQALGVISFLRMKKDVSKILLIAPPHLIKGSDEEPGHWERYIRDFFVNVKYVGKIDEITQSRILECEDSKGKFEITLVSSYGLSLLSSKSKTVEELSAYDVILVDEAHHFKNIYAKKRIILDEIVKRHREKDGENPYTVLLTATPIINDVAEILALMSIYLKGDTGDFDVLARTELDKDIIKEFESYQEATRKLKDTELEHSKRKKYEKMKMESLDEISKFLKEAIVLRSRAYIEKKYWGGKERRPRPKLKNMTYKYSDDELQMIDLIENLSLKYLDVSPSTLLFIRKISVRADNRKLDIQGEPITLQGIMKILLAKRLESSSYSFFQTLTKMRKTMEFIKDRLENGEDAHRIARDILLRKIGKLPDEDESLSIEGIEYEDKYDILKGEAFDNLVQHIDEILKDEEKLSSILSGIERDMQLIDKFMVSSVEDMARSMNSKETMILEYLRKMKGEKKKVIIYSMYVDTVEWLEKYLEDNGFPDEEIFVVTGKTKFKGAEIEKFREKAGFGVMLSTDALSEGVNLEFVDELVNYDIPWTPSTIMQRVGRLWRENRRKELIFYSILPPEELQNAFSSVIEKVEEKLKKIKDVLIQEIKLLKESDELTDDFEDKVYGNVYMEDESLHTFLKNLGEKGMEGLKNIILELINTEMISGQLVKNILRERNDEFNNIENRIKEGKILNMSYRSIPIGLLNFGKEWWMKIAGDFKFYNESEIAEEIKKGWETAKEGNRKIIWRVRGESIDDKQIINAFKNRVRRYITEIIKDRKSYEWRILNQLIQTTLEGTSKSLRELKHKAFLILAYYFYNKKRSQKRLKAISTLKELGFLDKNRNPNLKKFHDEESLKQLLELLGSEVEDATVEVLL